VLIVEGKADVDLEDHGAQTALSLAAENGYEGIVKMLQSTIMR
jgi:carbon monoxide dehydrogenase subunit G